MVDSALSSHRDMIERITLPVIVAAFLIQPDVALMSALDRLALLAVIMVGLVMVDAASYWAGMRRVVSVGIATALVIGTFTYVSSDEQSDKSSNDKRCAAIQHDMLSSMPLRSDGPDLFQALGCRPQGEGSVHAPRAARPFSLAEAKGK